MPLLDRWTSDFDCGYAVLTEHENFLEFNVLRTLPAYERLAVNVAMVAAIVEEYNDKLGLDFYIVDGARSIYHETLFQDYLEKYFEFREHIADYMLNIVFRSI